MQCMPDFINREMFRFVQRRFVVRFLGICGERIRLEEEAYFVSGG